MYCFVDCSLPLPQKWQKPKISQHCTQLPLYTIQLLHGVVWILKGPGCKHGTCHGLTPLHLKMSFISPIPFMSVPTPLTPLEGLYTTLSNYPLPENKSIPYEQIIQSNPYYLYLRIVTFLYSLLLPPIKTLDFALACLNWESSIMPSYIAYYRWQAHMVTYE